MNNSEIFEPDKYGFMYLRHDESDCVLKVSSEKELLGIFNDSYGALCVIISRSEYLNLKYVRKTHQ